MQILLTFVVLSLPLQQSRALRSVPELPAVYRSQTRYEIPRNTEEERPRELSTTEVKQQIQEKLRTEPGLAGAKIRVEANDSYVVLAGAIDNDCQRDLALRIAESYAGKRKIVDKIKTRGANMRQHDKCGDE
jgi:osmotically-inducible protein OsmY